MWCASQPDDLESALEMTCLPHTVVLAEATRTQVPCTDPCTDTQTPLSAPSSAQAPVSAQAPASDDSR